jgi:hypothetical protein|tara:strand:+ start:10 stop:141 length:132 start_codon:yes stop_codon:yes gene_type:complete
VVVGLMKLGKVQDLSEISKIESLKMLRKEITNTLRDIINEVIN